MKKTMLLRGLISACLLTVPLILSSCQQDLSIEPLSEPGASSAPSSEALMETAVGQETEDVSSVQDVSGNSADVSYYSNPYRRNWRWKNNSLYTKEDYELAVSFRQEGYQEKSVGEFDRSVMNWEDESAYHKTEEALTRLYQSLPEEDPNADFIYGTLANAWTASEKKHYSTCEREKNMWYDSYAVYKTFGDVYGDQVLMTEAFADFDFDYQIPDEAALTVGERDTILSGIKDNLEAFLAKQPAEKLRQEASMEKLLDAELKKELEALDPKITWAGNVGVSYYWEAPYEAEWYEDDTEDDGTDDDDTEDDGTYAGYTPEQYDLVLKTLHYDTWQDMTVADFNRMVHAVFTEDDKSRFSQSFEMVCSSLSEDDPNREFLSYTVSDALHEYQARARTVYSGKQADPSRFDSIYMERTADVYGDQITVGTLEAEFTYTYRIHDADRLTMREKEQFFEKITSDAEASLEALLQKGAVTENDLINALEDAGKKAGTKAISLTGCEVNYLYYNEEG